ncbi:MAG: HlyD family type I secretion periplasmic adaptor subunit [Phreatobacter sp.]|uniref:HlyD family type I secretion periplasmic adaptor subunit n=1 Tax=Phreatobacter sp. TaxID=1966341 RepID=UPI0027339B0E|nr:HlyD family type I secretion periplasmic adaptor subunit [Phreatobacter sp.]MDP2803742.1 HlyD family type I secretion periplasmic adaptor subunit [Phreatobacter sp.]
MSRDDRQPGLAPDIDRASGKAKRAGYLALVIFLGTLGVWGARASIAGAVVAQGNFVVENSVKKVQHQQGGIVGELRVREGQVVREGDLLIRLDDTMARANLQILTRQIDEFVVRSARLEAERDQAGGVIVPASLGARAVTDPTVADLLAAEQRLFAIRATALEGQRAQLAQRIGQMQSEIEGLSQQRAAKVREAQLIQRELTGVRDLFTRNLVQITRLSQLEREESSLEGQKGLLTAQIAQVQGRIAETGLQIIQLTEERRSEAMKELRDIQGRMGELLERRTAAEDQLKRVDIRAPASGIVHQMQAHTVGGVISAAEPAMLIVPSGELLHLDAQIAATDYDLVSLGQQAQIRLRAFNQRTTPELTGTVSRLAPDVTREQQTGLTYYIVRITIPPAELARIAPLTISAGMQADVFLATGDRSPVSYLVRPVLDQFAKAFRER